MPFIYGLGFEIKNETSSTLTAKLVAGEIPSRNAGFNEFNETPDSGIRGNCTINSEKEGLVSQSEFCTNLSEGKFISFVFTISRGNETVYRVVGWDVPEGDMETYRIDDKMFGFFDPAEQGEPPNPDDSTPYFLRLTSKLFPTSKCFPPNEEETNYVRSATYYIRATPTGIALHKMEPFLVRGQDHWG